LAIPVICSSGAGREEHFSAVLEKSKAEATLAAGIFHREEVPIEAVKKHLRDE
jgi:glutamine amidotransferase/cyclase